MKNKILVIGSNSCLGKQIILTLKEKKIFEVKSLNRKQVDVSKQFSKLEKIIFSFKPEYIINCVAITGLIYCEDKPELAYEINSFFPSKLVEFLNGKKIKFIHFSTEAVFLGNVKNKIYSEKDFPNPKSIYGKSKLLADLVVKNYSNTLIIRLPMLFGPTHKNQIVDKLTNHLINKKSIYVSTDVYSTPVYTPLLAKYISSKIISNNFFFDKKIIHFTSNNYCSIYKMMMQVAKKIKKEKLVNPVKDSYFGFNKLKPKYLGLKTIFKYSTKNYNIEEFINHYE